MQSITVKVLPATNTKPYRLKATSTSGLSVTMTQPWNLDVEESARLAAEELCKKLGWPTHLIQASTKDGWVFVFPPKGLIDAAKAVIAGATHSDGSMSKTTSSIALSNLKKAIIGLEGGNE